VELPLSRLQCVVQMTKEVNFGDLLQLTPVSDCWGFDRGQPIDRFYIETFMSRHAARIAGVVLEIGGPLYATKFGRHQVDTVEILDVGGGADATYDDDLSIGTGLPGDRFDCAIVTQTLQYVYDVSAAIATLHRIVKPSGTVLATVPGITRISEREYPDAWFWAFTQASASRLFGDVFGPEDVEVTTYGNVLAASSFLYGLAAEELAPEQLAHEDPDFPVTVAIRAVK